MLAGIYCRVSSKHQLKEGYSIPEQEAAIRYHVNSKGDSVIQVWHEDISGITLTRPKLDEILAIAKSGGIEVLYAYDLDRLARGPVAVNVIEEQLKRLGVRIEYVRMDFDDSAEGQMLKMIMATFSGYEREKFRERTMRGKGGKAKAGKIAHGGKPCYGYRIDEGYHYEIYEPEASVVRQVFTWYVQDKWGTVKIAAELNKRGILTQTGCAWRNTPISRMLKHEVYAGRYVYGRTEVVNGKQIKKPQSKWIYVPVPPLVDEETFQAAQQQSVLNTNFSRRNAKHEYLLSGIIYCATCGRRYYGGRHGRYDQMTGRYRYKCGGFVDISLGNPSHSGCLRTTLDAEIYDELIWNKIKSILTSPERIVEALVDAESSHADRLNTLTSQMDILERQLKEVEKAEKKLVELYTVSDLDHAVVGGQLVEYKQRKVKIKETIEETQHQIEASQKTLKTQDILELCEVIARNIDSFTFEEKRKALMLLEVKVYVDRTTTPYSIKITGLLPSNLAEDIDPQSPWRW